eukprot:4020775-Prymnesium_polylepis.1
MLGRVQTFATTPMVTSSRGKTMALVVTTACHTLRSTLPRALAGASGPFRIKEPLTTTCQENRVPN